MADYSEDLALIAKQLQIANQLKAQEIVYQYASNGSLHNDARRKYVYEILNGEH